MAEAYEIYTAEGYEAFKRIYKKRKEEYADAAEKADDAVNKAAEAYEALKADPIFRHENGLRRGVTKKMQPRPGLPKRARAKLNEMNFHVNVGTHARPPPALQVLDSQPVSDLSGSSEHDLSHAPAATGSQPAEADPDGSDGESWGVCKGRTHAPPQAADKHRQPQSKATAFANLKTSLGYKQAVFVPATPPPPAQPAFHALIVVLHH